MPAPSAHPLVVIPLRRCGLLLSGLIIGSMIPDLVYILPVPVSDQFGHTLPGLFLFCLPAGLGVFFIFHLWVKYPLFSLFPEQHQQRLWRVMSYMPVLSWKHVITILVSILVGAVTHITWDAFTHWYGWGVQRFEFFQMVLFTSEFGTLRLYKVLQHGSTILGTLALFYWYVRWTLKTPPIVVSAAYTLNPLLKRYILLGSGIAAGLSGIIYGYIQMPGQSGFESFSLFVVLTVRASIAVVLVEAMLFSIWWQFSRLEGKVFSLSRALHGRHDG